MATGQASDRRAAVPLTVTHLSRDERIARGRAARKATPRSRHAELDVSSRPDPVALLEAQAATRVPELVPIRRGRMLASPFAFYRGAAAVMASDLSRTAVSGLRVQACGDAHLANFGAFGSPERRLVFDINDFDETLPGPWEWDVKRLATSFEIAGRELGHGAAQRRDIVLRCLRSYREAMRGFAAQGNLAVWYASLDVEATISQARGRVSKAAVRRAERNVAKAYTRDSLQALGKLSEVVDGELRFRSAPPLVERATDLFPDHGAEMAEWARQRLREYRATLQHDRRALLEQFRFVDLARKVVGVGSVGTRCFIVLLLGVDDSDPLILQVKEASPSVLEPYVGRSVYRNSGHRVIAGQRLMQSASDMFLGYQAVRGVDGVQRDFYWRQLRDWKGSAEIDGMEPGAMRVFARACGTTLARGHARTGDRVAIAAYLGSGDAFDQAVARFASAYADLNESDYAALRSAVDSGSLAAQTEV
ncbi:MAG TPA: DUF2252 domain-containing protein [Miltoncostaeaceae bacterium]|nr:DUF2252 domain-containing protein [Miltoncostaeaceae bacterium]